MASPPVTARTTPTGYKLPEGFRITHAFSNNPSVQIWEKTVKPPGIKGGELIDTTTQLNLVWGTMNPRYLKRSTPVSIKFAYDPDCIPELLAMVNQNQGITDHFPDNASISYWGAITDIEFDALEEGKLPEGTCTIGVTNFDPTNLVEAGPLFVPASGTA
jgi:hypothetical protein